MNQVKLQIGDAPSPSSSSEGLPRRRAPVGLLLAGLAVFIGGFLSLLSLAEHPVSARSKREAAAIWLMVAGGVTSVLLALRSQRREARRIAERTSELEQMSETLLRANRAKNEFLANVSHELRTPLNAIVGFTELLREGVYGELTPRQALPVQRIEASANHLRHLVDQILDLARIAAGRLEVHREPIDLRPFLIDVATELEPLAQERGLALSLKLGSSIPRVHTDPTHLRHIIMNLLGNALKFTQAGSVTVRTRYVDDPSREPSGPPRKTGLWVAIQVADTGIGIALKDRERIFEEFERAPADPKGGEVQRGTGLGLAISRRLARLLGGDIALQSEAGSGSTFTLWLPLDDRVPPTA
jgi:signal transduction histidine kinase